MVYQERPTTSGYYWMRWKRKWGRRFLYDIVWCSECDRDRVRDGMTWKEIVTFPKAMFYGPLVAPK